MHNEETVDIELEHIDSQNARACDAAIRDLPPLYRAVLHAEYLGARWTFEGHDLQARLREAHALVRRGLLLRSVYVSD